MTSGTRLPTWKERERTTKGGSGEGERLLGRSSRASVCTVTAIFPGPVTTTRSSKLSAVKLVGPSSPTVPPTVR
ncbi:hypothetical protein Nepgr_026745 [Nepenthes gracilis]|uniref:Uncharacterized protein n=1 Tax=Nepenthes gracilis TaxID=150966 RepID=A0AAD3TAG1_NEPGR|nr:hypothetical protein Nepgr_026745 [Nepenthes gracilis]